ncbi:ATP-binding protein [Hungatella sp. L12]|uniref:ATP-binding protein n=1 Tax=Hungatella hominis TaxID=2763050 RepID=A0ABR7H8X4_9FIRM|nr:AAA family ATPase [Hungatella hominis]MBC5709640.1 ATP-binding protein [Hungatella hominis]
MIIGVYYIQLKDAHINWGKHRKTNTRKLRDEEAYIAIPAEYAYAYNLKKGDIYLCVLENGKSIELKASGSQSRKEYAKQFEGNGNLKIIYDWYKSKNAVEGDYVVVTIYDNKTIDLEFISATDHMQLLNLNIFGKKGKISKLDERVDVGFRLISLKLKNRESEYYNIRFFPDDLKSKSERPITTLIIGANGAGKSFILMILSDIFNAVQNANSVSQLKYTYYGLKYILNGDLIEIEIINRAVIIHKNDVLLDKGNYALPKKVLAVAFMLNDKFHFKQNTALNENNIYEYLGVRVTSNASWTSSIGNKIAECLVNLASNERLQDFIERLSKYLELDSKISIGCEISEGDFRCDDLKTFLIKCGQKITDQEEFRRDAVKRISEEDYEILAEYVSEIRKNNLYIQEGNKIQFGIVFSTDNTRDEILKVKNDYKLIRDLCNLKIIKNLSLYLYKKGEKYSFDDASSGEKHILYSFANIFNTIEKNSLVLIDEPEISLHPNWQIKYISFLKDVFKDYSSCHFVIATHSHYLVSDLDPESSSLITMENGQNNEKIVNTINYSTYAWSAENILYNLFGVRMTRNYYFDSDVRQLLYLISHQKKEELFNIKKLYCKLRKYVLDENDPLKYVLDEAKEYINNVECSESS